MEEGDRRNRRKSGERSGGRVEERVGKGVEGG